MDSPELVEVEQQVTTLATDWLADAERLEITTAEDAQVAADFLCEDIAPRRKAVEAFFEPLVRAAHATHKMLTTRRAQILARFEEPERIVRRKLAEWHAAQRAIQQQIEDAARLARQQSGGGIVLPPVEPEPLQGVSFTSRVSAEVVDMAALIQAAAAQPSLRPLLLPNQKALDDLARALGDALNVPGVIVRREQMTRVRA